MDTGDIYTVITLVILVMLSAFFSASETAYTSLNTVRMKRLAGEGNRRAEKVLKLAENYDSLISTILVGNNIVNILSASMATVLFVRYFANDGVTISTVVMTVVVLLFGEIAPKSVAKDNAEKIAMIVCSPLYLITRFLTPVNWLLGLWQRLLDHFFKGEEDHGYTEEELITIVEEAESEGEIDVHESELIRSAIEFTDVAVEEILVPRVDMTAVSITAAHEEIDRVFKETGFSRIPVYQDTVDNVVGILHEKDFFMNGARDIKRIMTTPLYVMMNTKISDLLKLFQKSKSHMAIVVDEYDGVQGLVTMEDVLEELVGEIWDEHDDVSEDFVLQEDGSYLVSGSANLDDMLELYDIHTEYDPVTVNGWVQEQLGRFPKAGDSFECDGLSVTVRKIERRRATEVSVAKATALNEE